MKIIKQKNGFYRKENFLEKFNSWFERWFEKSPIGWLIIGLSFIDLILLFKIIKEVNQ